MTKKNAAPESGNSEHGHYTTGVRESRLPTTLQTIQAHASGWVTHKIKVPFGKGGKRVAGTYGSSQHTAQLYKSTSEAWKAKDAYGHDGIGYVLQENRNGPTLCIIDLDRVRDPGTGIILPDSRKLVELMGAGVLVSPSGTGLHIVTLLPLDSPLRRRNGAQLTLDGIDKHQVFFDKHYFRLGTLMGDLP